MECLVCKQLTKQGCVAVGCLHKLANFTRVVGGRGVAHDAFLTQEGWGVNGRLKCPDWGAHRFTRADTMKGI